MQGPEVWPRDSLSYRRCVGTLAVVAIVQCGSLLVHVLKDGGLRAVIGATSIHQGSGSLNYHRSSRWSGTKQATLAQASLTVLCGVGTLAAAFLSTLDERPVNILLSLLAATSRWVDAVYSWERFMLVHPDFNPTRRQQILVRLFILIGLCLPYLTPPIYWTMAAYGKLLKQRHPWWYRGIAAAVTVLDVFMVPANVYWDCSLGCRFINKIKQLNVSLQSGDPTGSTASTSSSSSSSSPEAPLSYTRVLLSLSRNTLAYIVISSVANLALVLAYSKIIPGVALVSLLFHLCFSFTTFYLLGAKASTVTFASFSRFTRYYASFLRGGVGVGSHRQQQQRPLEGNESHVWSASASSPGGTIDTAASESTQTVATPPEGGAKRSSGVGGQGRSKGETGSGSGAFLPEEEASEREGLGPLKDIALCGSPSAPSSRQSPATPQSLSPSWGLRGHPSCPSDQGSNDQGSNSHSRAPLRFFAQRILRRGRDTRGLFRLSEEPSQVGSDSSCGKGSELAPLTPVSGESGRRGGGLWRSGGGKARWSRRPRSMSSSSTGTAAGREAMLGFDQAFSPSASSPSSSSTGGEKAGAPIMSPPSV